MFSMTRMFFSINAPFVTIMSLATFTSTLMFRDQFM